MTLHDTTGLIEVLVWPITVFVVVILLRPELVRLIGRVREFEGPGNVKIGFDPQKLEQVVESAKQENASPKAIARQLEQSVTLLDNREARILRALLDDDGRAIYNYQTDYYRPALDSLLKRGYVQREAKGFALTPLGKTKTKQYLLPVLDRISG